MNNNTYVDPKTVNMLDLVKPIPNILVKAILIFFVGA